MPNNETTTKFRVDISDLRKAMQEAKRYVAVANSEFKAVSSSMDDWRKSTDGLEAKLTQLDKVLDAQNRQLQILEADYNNLTDEQKKGSKAADDLIIKINNQKAAINKTERDINKYSTELSELKSEANKTGSELDELGDSAKKSGDEAEDGAEGYTVLKDVLADLVADGIRKTIEALQELASDGSKAYSQFAAATGTATGEMDKWEDAIQQVYKDNFGDSLEDVAEKMSIVNQTMRDLSPDEMVAVTEAAMTLEDTFGMDMNESIRGVQNLMTHFGLTSEEALNYISQGAQNGLNYTDELGDNIAEYSGKFAEAGYSAEDYFQLLQNGSDNGAYNLDKVNDAINEVTTRIGDGTIEDSLDMFSTGTQDVFKAWQDGKATQKDVIDSIVGDIQGAKSEQDKMNMSAKAFGTMAEDGGTKFIQSLTSVGNSYDDVNGKAKELQDIKYNDVGSALSGLGRTIKTELLQPIVDKIVPVVTDFLNWCINHMNIVLPIVTGLAAAFGVLATALGIQGIISSVTKAMALLNGVMALNPAILIAAAVVGLVAALVVLIAKNKKVQKALSKAWEHLKKTFSDLATSIKKNVEKITSFFKSIIKFIQKNWSTLLLMLINPFAGLFAYFYKNNKKFKEFVDNAITQIKQLPTKFNIWLTETMKKVSAFATNLINKGKEAATKFVNAVITVVKNLPSKVGTWLTNTVKKVTTFATTLATKGKAAGEKLVTSVVNKVKNLPSKMATQLSNAVKKVSTFASNLAAKGKAAGEKLVSAVTNKVKTLAGKLKSIGGDAVKGLWNGIKNKSAWLKGKIKSWVGDVTSWLKKFFKIGSPSRLMADEVGQWLPAGIGVGVEKNTKPLYDSLQSMGALAVSGLNSGASITTGSGGVTGGAVNNFYQTINSPKQLSRLEIYRQSKNLLGYAGGR